MPKALHVLGSLDPGGVERWLRDAVRLHGVTAWRFDFCLLGPTIGAYEPELKALGSRVLRCPLRPRASFPARLFRLLRRERYAVVHSHVHHFSGVILGVAHAAGTPVRIAHSHTHGVRAVRSIRRGLYEHAARALLGSSMTAGIACSPQAASFAGIGLRSRFRVQPCGIDLRAFLESPSDRPRLRRELGIPPDAAVVGHVGRLAVEKNHAFLLRAFAGLLHLVPPAWLVITGCGPLRAELETLARQMGLRERVIFTGPRHDVPALLAAFDALALPSLREGLPAVVLEAQAAGLPAVVSEQTPPEAIVAPQLVERLEFAGNPQMWAAALASALSRPRGIRSEICRRLRERGFDAAKSFSSLTQIYEQHLESGPSARKAGSSHGIARCRRSSPQV